jgi:hypothetical protein
MSSTSRSFVCIVPRRPASLDQPVPQDLVVQQMLESRCETGRVIGGDGDPALADLEERAVAGPRCSTAPSRSTTAADGGADDRLAAVHGLDDRQRRPSLREVSAATSSDA